MLDEPSQKRGRGHPPAEHRFKKGQSGNPKGRPKKAAPTVEAVETAEILDRIKRTKVSVQSGESVREIPYIEALLNGLASAGLRNPRDGFRMLQFLMASAGAPLPQEAVSNEEFLNDPIVKRHLERELRKRLWQQGEGAAATDLMREQFRPAGGRDEDEGGPDDDPSEGA